MKDLWSEYERVRDLVLDQRASEAEVSLLEQFVLDSPKMKRDYVEHAHMIAVLGSGAADDAGESASSHSNTSQTNALSSARQFRWSSMLAALAASLFLAWLGWSAFQSTRDDTFAKIALANQCRWGESSLPTSVDQPLGKGRLRLASGIAVVRFPLVNVSLEGPVDFELISGTRCRVHSGRILASVQKGGEGFVVETPTAKLVDRGTKFGVNVVPSLASDLQVLSGQVDVSHIATGKLFSVMQDQIAHISAQSVGVANDKSEVSPTESVPVGLKPTGTSLQSIQISTAIGIGDDGYVASGVLPAENSSSKALLVKLPPSSGPDDWGERWRRKAFLKFDLTLAGKSRIETAALQLYGVPTEIGFGSLMPDATFFVYGLVDDSQDDWKSRSLTWKNSPAQSKDEIELEPSKVRLLGAFEVPQANPFGRFEIETPELADFLKNDANRQATLVIIPKTAGEGAAYVHGFASKRHPDFPAPTLRLEVKEDDVGK